MAKKKINLSISEEVLEFINWYCKEEVETKSGLVEKYFKKLRKRYEHENSAFKQFLNTVTNTSTNTIDLTSDCIKGE